MEEDLSWDNFIENTTFHGIKHIFSSGRLRPRRFLWLVCVLAAVSVFSWQVIERALTYYDYNTSVDVEVIYQDSQDFPAVTICNQNTFRLTATTDANLYDVIDNVYSHRNSSDNLTLVDDDTKMVDIMTKISHTREDFITRCEWNGEPCDSKYIREVLTDYGVCYTFNYDQDNVLRATAAGSQNGLKLVLNIEQYEYMKGPQSEAGIQVLLHNQTEVPQVKSLGFAVAPGTHTLVGIERQDVENLPPPYGYCMSGVPPLSNCQLQTQIRQDMSTCGCVGAFLYQNQTMRDELPMCDVSQQFHCIHAARVKGSRGKTNASCPVPCERTVYTPSLSYAMLAKFNIHSEVFGDQVNVDEEVEAIRRKLIKSQEVKHRVVASALARDAVHMDAFMAAARDLYEALNVSIESMETSADVADLFNITDVLELGVEVLASDIDDMSDVVASRKSLLEKLFRGVSFFKGIQDINITLQDDAIYDGIQYCLDSGITGTNPQFGTLPDQTCTDTIQSITDTSRNIQGLSPGMFGFWWQLYVSDYNSIIDTIFGDTKVDLSANTNHTTCMEALDVMTSGQASDMVSTLSNILDNDLAQQSDLAIIRDRYQQAAAELTQPSLAPVSELLDSELAARECRWLPEAHVVISSLQPMGSESERDKWTRLLEVLDTAQVRLGQAAQSFARMSQSLITLMDKYEDKLGDLAERVTDYRAGLISMVELVNTHWRALLVQTAIYDVSYTMSEMTQAQDSMYNLMQEAQDNMANGYQMIWTLQLPVYDYAKIFSSRLWTELIEPCNNTDVVAQREALLNRTTWPPDLGPIISTLFETAQFARAQRRKLTEANGLWVDRQADLQDHFDQFRSVIVPDEQFLLDNFLQVDIFYKELRYDRVTQRPTFEMLSLLGEVGGFLGLLLGASVLTVIELLDYLIRLAVFSCNEKKKKNKNVSDSEQGDSDPNPEKAVDGVANPVMFQQMNNETPVKRA